MYCIEFRDHEIAKFETREEAQRVRDAILQLYPCLKDGLIVDSFIGNYYQMQDDLIHKLGYAMMSLIDRALEAEGASRIVRHKPEYRDAQFREYNEYLDSLYEDAMVKDLGISTSQAIFHCDPTRYHMGYGEWKGNQEEAEKEIA